MICTGYLLPFVFVYTKGVLSSGSPSCLRIRCGNPGGLGAVVEAVDAFSSLACSGALCGASIDPALSALRLRRQPRGLERDLCWSVERALLCEEALVVLAHLLLAASADSGIEGVEFVDESSDGPPVTLAFDPTYASTYPPVSRQLGFGITNDDLQADAYAFEIHLEQALADSGEAWLQAMLEAWSKVVCLGGFGTAPQPPESGYVEPDDAVVSYDTTVEWAFFKLRADEACVDTLVNGFAAFHRRCQAIQLLEIS